MGVVMVPCFTAEGSNLTERYSLVFQDEFNTQLGFTTTRT